MAVRSPKFDGPIPGQSLTAEPGSVPWENPSKYTTVEEAAEFYFEKILDPKNSADILVQIEDGLPLTLLADSLQTLGVFKGLHTVHTGVLVSPVIIELLKAISEDADIDYVIGIEEDALISEQDKSMAFRALKKVYPNVTKKQVEGAVAEAKEAALDEMNKPNEAQMEGSMAEETPKKGLMAKKAEQSEMM